MDIFISTTQQAGFHWQTSTLGCLENRKTNRGRPRVTMTHKPQQTTTDSWQVTEVSSKTPSSLQIRLTTKRSDLFYLLLDFYELRSYTRETVLVTVTLS